MKTKTRATRNTGTNTAEWTQGEISAWAEMEQICASKIAQLAGEGMPKSRWGETMATNQSGTAGRHSGSGARRRRLTPEGRAAIAEASRKRWAKIRREARAEGTRTTARAGKKPKTMAAGGR